MVSQRASMVGLRLAASSPAWRARKRSRAARGNRQLLFENLEQRLLLAADWQNAFTRLDVSDNGVVTPLDALVIINELNHRRISDDTGQLPPRPLDWPPGELIDTSGNGVISSLDALLVINALNGDRQPPVITVGLLADTAPQGTFNSDGVTSNAMLTGQVHDELTGVAALQAQVDLSPFRSVNYDPRRGTFTLDPGLLPGGIADGTHTIHFQARDAVGNFSPVTDFSFTFDTLAPVAPAFALSLTSALGDTQDDTTSAARVTLVGHTDPSTTATLSGLNLSALSSSGGDFRFPGVTLDLGDNLITVTATDAAGNASTYQTTLHRVDNPPTPDPVLFWNQAALEAIRLDATTPPGATRNLAMLHTAVYDVVSNLEGTPSYSVVLQPPAGASPVAAVSAAAHRVLAYLYPGQAASLEATLTTALASVPDGLAKTDGLQFGATIGDAVIALRAGDGWDKYVDDVPGSGPGVWQPTAPMYDVPLLPQWGDVQPFALSSADQFRPAGPPMLESQAYADALNEVKLLGSATSSTRTADQTQIARFWADGAGTYTPAGHWNQIAEQVAVAQGNSLSENARLFAELDLALADAAVTAWNTKFAAEFWRPITAIRAADTDGNAATAADPQWTPLLITPSFPEYVSGHSTFSGAAAEILTQVFGDQVSFTTDSLSLPGVLRSFTSFQQAADEAGRSRIYGGIHYEFSDRDGLVAGQAVADLVLDRFTSSQDDVAPRALISSPAPSLVTSQNVTLSGKVLDNLSGVQSFEVQRDGGSFAAVPFTADGSFTLLTQLAIGGTEDGLHTFTFRVQDFSGNSSIATQFSFTLDTQTPTLTIVSPAVSGQISAGAELVGTASGSGSPLTLLNYSLDGGTEHPLVLPGAAGDFRAALDMSLLTAGSHTLLVRAQDAAGLTTQSSVAFDLTRAIPFALARSTPLDGANDVGATFHPQVFFSRPVDPASLSANNFFATDAADSKLPATIVPAQDGSFAWLYLAAPLPGGSTIAVHVDGGTIHAQAGSELLDADGDGAPGGVFEYHYTTVSLTPLAGTSLSGKVVDPGPDLKPMTLDDIRAGADGVLHTPDDVLLHPLAHVKVFLLGLESQAVFTDADGNFHFDAVPTGDAKLALDGRTATGVPDGFYFPEMVMDLNLEVGQSNTVMGTMGSRAEREANRDRQEVYLPRLQTSLLRDVSGSQPMTIGVDADSAPNLTPAQRQIMTLEVQPGSLIGPDGQPLASGQVGISTVPPELVRDMLPPGLLQHTFDITVQAPGISNFSVPAPLTFPNVFNAPAGTQLNFLSFDHTTGRLVIEGTATVSADGLSVHTDPGTGITHPGWHGLTSPGSAAAGGNPGPADCSDQSTFNHLVTGGFVGDVITVDLNSTGLKDFELQEASNDFGFVAQIENWQDVLKTSGRFLFVPDLPAGAGTSELELKAVTGPDSTDCDGTLLPAGMPVKLIVQFKEVSDGYSSNGVNAVTSGTSKEAVYRQQQRLKYLGFPDHNGNPLVVDGLSGGNTRWAISLFNAAVSDTNVDANSTVPNPFINALNAPRWQEFPAGGRGWKNTDTPTDNQDWGTSWALEVVGAAGAQNTGTVLMTNDVSFRMGGFTNDHKNHQAGMDVDIETPSQDTSATPFYGTRAIGGTEYIAGADTTDAVGNTVHNIIRHNPTTGQYFASPTTGSLADAVVNNDANYQNEALLRDISGLIVNHADYDYKDVRKQIQAFSNIVTPSGASVVSIFYNDPRTWDIAGVVFRVDHGGHFHVNIGAPAPNFAAQPAGPEAGIHGTPAAPRQAAAISTAPGFGSDPRLFYRFELGNGFQVVGRSDPAGNVSVFLAPNASFAATFYQASTNRAAVYHGRTNLSGVPTELGTIILDQFGGPDSDGDGIPDVGERAIGTGSTRADTDGDGISDAAEIEEGLDPLGGRSFPTGVIAGVTLRGRANDIAVEVSPDNSQHEAAYVATDAGLAIVDVSQFDKPIILSQLDLQVSTAVAVDTSTKVAVVSHGRQASLVNISDSLNPVVLRNLDIPGGAGRVVAFDGLAYVTSGSELLSFELATGEPLQALDLGGGTLTDVTQEGPMLYSMDTNLVVRAVDISGADMVARGALTMPDGGGRLFVGNGIAYAAALNREAALLSGGFATADVSNPDHLTLISGSDIAPGIAAAGEALRANGSGVGVQIGLLRTGLPFPTLELWDLTDLSQTDRFLTQYALPATPNGLALAAGIAFVADGSSGLQVVNYLSFDSQGQAPSVAVSTSALDVDPNTPALQVVRGTTIPVHVHVTDDVQVRDVELLVNDKVVSRGVTFPFELSAVAYGVDQAATTVKIQARATDTGGNSTLSDPLVLDLLPDAVPPSIVSVTPADGAKPSEGLQGLLIRFSEPLATSTVTDQTFELLDASGTLLTPIRIQRRTDDTLVQLTYAPLPAGSYQLVIDAAAVQDRSGNPLGASQVVSHFVLSPVVHSGPAPIFSNQVFPTGYSPTSMASGDFNGDGIPDVATGGTTLSVLLGQGDGTFAPRKDLTSDVSVSVAAGDVDGDGSLDLVAANTTSAQVFLGNGDGTFRAPVESTIAFGLGTTALGDLNGDGKLDLVTTTATPALSVLLGHGDGTFSAQVDYADSFATGLVTLGDLNGDGKPDVVTATSGVFGNTSQTISVFLNNGDGTLAARHDITVGQQPTHVAVGDLNNDGKVDLVTANQGAATVSVLLGNGDGTFANHIDYAVGVRPRAVVLADINGDAKLDLLTANFADGSVSVLLNLGFGSLGNRTEYLVGPQPNSILLVDANIDGNLDIVTTSESGSAVWVLTSDGNGGFNTPPNFAVGGGPTAVALGDVNHDGIPDVVSANGHDSTVSVLLGTGPGLLGARTDYMVGSGVLKFGNLDLGPDGVAVGDLNGDGNLDIVAATDQDSTISVLLGNGDGTFQNQVIYAVTVRPIAVALGDVNGDNILDIIAAGGSASVLLGTGDGSFAASTNVDLFSSQGSGTAAGLALGDINGDGSLDIAVAFNSGLNSANQVIYRLGLGDGTFASQSGFAIPGQPISLAVGDLDSDGMADVVTANFSRSLSVLLSSKSFNQTVYADGRRQFFGTLTLADVDGDGKLDILATNLGGGSVAVFLNAGDGTFSLATEYGTSGNPVALAVGDLDGNGTLDVVTVNRRSLSPTAEGNISSLLNLTNKPVPRPAAQLHASLIDIDPNAPSVQVVEGTPIPISVLVSGALPTTNIEFLVNGAVAATSSSATLWQFAIAAPAAFAPTPLTMQARITDALGRQTLSEVVLATVLPDTAPPTVTSISPADGVTFLRGLRQVEINFSKPMATAAVTNGNIRLVDSGGNTQAAVSLRLLDGDRIVQFTYSPLLSGVYRLLIDATAVTDVYGNALGAGTVVKQFTLIDSPLPPVARPFFPDPIVETGLEPVAVAAGDLNGDGQLDVVTANRTGSSVSVLLGNGDGTFDTHVDYTVGTGPQAVVLGDVNGDSVLDVIVAGGPFGSAEGSLAVLLGNRNVSTGKGDGTFGPPADYALAAVGIALALGDVESDGHIDIVVGLDPGLAPGAVSVFLNDGVGGFSGPTDYATGVNIRSMALSDVNGDHDLDLLVGVEGDSGGDLGPRENPRLEVRLGGSGGTFGDVIQHDLTDTPRALALGNLNAGTDLDMVTSAGDVLLGNGDGTFTAGTNFVPGNRGGLALGDLSGDGKLDVVTSDYGVSVLLGNGDATFGSDTDYSGADGASSLVLGDFNHDGRLDVITVSSTAGGIFVLPGRGDGSFATQLNSPSADAGDFVVLGDLNHDGNLDVVGGPQGQNGFSLALGNGNGTFQPPVNRQVIGRPESAALGDVNGDGNLDVVTTNQTGNNVAISLGAGDGSFYARTGDGVDSSPTAVALGYVNGDGNLDLAVTNGGKVTVLLGWGDGSFGKRADYTVGAGPVAVALGDVNGDGLLDLVTANSGFNGDSVTVLLGSTTGVFGQRTDVPVGQQPQSLALGDLNGDGNLDIVTGNIAGDSVSVLLGRGDGTFAAKTDYAVPLPINLTLGDVNRDGAPDLIVASGSSVTVFLGVGDGTFAAKTVYVIKANSLALGDLNHDGKLDLVGIQAGALLPRLNEGAPLPLRASRDFPPAVATQAVAEEAPAQFQAEVHTLASAAVAWWERALGVPLSIPVAIRIGDVPAGELAYAQPLANGWPGGSIVVDAHAGGLGWFVDPTPFDHAEFPSARANDAFAASPGSLAWGKYDLLTVLLHEVGHVLGFDEQHVDDAAHPLDLMNDTLAPSIRKLPSAFDVEVLDALFAGGSPSSRSAGTENVPHKWRQRRDENSPAADYLRHRELIFGSWQDLDDVLGSRD